MRIAFNILYIFLLIFYLPVLWLKGKIHPGYKIRLGRLPADFLKEVTGQKNIWIHAVSVGEVMAVIDLVKRMKERFAGYRIVCTTVTPTGLKVARKELKGLAVSSYAPVDFSWAVKQYVSTINPAIYIAAETEIWPNLYLTLKKKNIPIIQINGRISDKSFRRYLRLKPLTKRVLACVRVFCMQSQEDADRIIQLGALKDKVEVIGNLKFDNLPEPDNADQKKLGFSAKDELLIAGSTHPGEEEILTDIYKELKEAYPALRLVICPRHVERSPEIIQMIESKGLGVQSFSSLSNKAIGPEAVLVVDEIGRLKDLYGLAKLVFIGKTLTVGGGQNMIEPACFAKPIVTGPHTYNFKDVMQIFLNEKAICQLKDSDELKEEIIDLLSNPVRCQSLGLAAQRVVHNYRGATQKTLERIGQLLEKNYEDPRTVGSG